MTTSSSRTLPDLVTNRVLRYIIGFFIAVGVLIASPLLALFVLDWARLWTFVWYPFIELLSEVRDYFCAWLKVWFTIAKLTLTNNQWFEPHDSKPVPDTSNPSDSPTSQPK